LACARLFLRPLMEKMLGRDPETGLARARLTHALPANGAREHYLRAVLDVDSQGQQQVRAYDDQDSSLISVFAAANALIRQPADSPPLAAGALVEVLPLTCV